MTLPPTRPAIRDAASLILLRETATGPQVLMGKRAAGAVFMPDIHVFPGGAVDAGDAQVPLGAPLPSACASALQREGGPAPATLAAAAIRETWEETGLRLACTGGWPTPPDDWKTFADQSFVPDASQLRYLFRAITPQGRPRRFDARFFLAPVSAVAGDPDQLIESPELTGLAWLPLDDPGAVTLAPVTEVVLAHLRHLYARGLPPAPVPFFDGSDEDWSIAQFRDWLARQRRA